MTVLTDPGEIYAFPASICLGLLLPRGGWKCESALERPHLRIPAEVEERRKKNTVHSRSRWLDTARNRVEPSIDPLVQHVSNYKWTVSGQRDGMTFRALRTVGTNNT